MTTLEIAEALAALEITDGFAIRNGLIVLWENEKAIPESLENYVQLDVNK